MKFAAVLLVSLAASSAFAGPVGDEGRLEKETGAQKLDMKEVEKLLQQIEAEQNKPKPDDGTVSESLNKLFATFRQMTGAYINVLNAVNKSLGLPKYPTIPGLGAREDDSEAPRQDDQVRPPMPLRQIQDNLRQLQNSAIEVGSMVRRVVSNMSQESRTTVLNQFRKFTDMWSKQLGELSGMLQDAVVPNARQDDQANILQRFSQRLAIVLNQFRESVSDFYTSIRNRIIPTPVPAIQAAPAGGKN